MADYVAPVKDIMFVLEHLVDIDSLCRLPWFSEVDTELLATVLEAAGKFAAGELAPLNSVGDQVGTRLVARQVREASGFAEAYRKFIAGGWAGVSCNPRYGGMGLPDCVGAATMEMWSAANVSFALCPMLGQGAIEAIEFHASQSIRDIYLRRMVSGEWTGTMNLTEPQAGSDLAAIKTHAVRDGDDFRIFGSKIFITWGDHSMTDNIVHLVLARINDAPEGVRGLSLFLVPKYLVGTNGNLVDRNDVYPGSVEHKMGIHGSPTCVMNYGDAGAGAIGYLIGEENAGLACMFTMMNHARLNVGVEGVALADRAYQKALRYAHERVQGKAPGQANTGPIIAHPDVRRMLMSMRALTEASRALCILASSCFDRGRHTTDELAASEVRARGELLVPLAKGWATEVSQEVTSLGVQIHGGMGFIEETGAAQLMRDARITTIYEGTTGIQANDFIGRKVGRNGGRDIRRLIDDMRGDLPKLDSTDALSSMRPRLAAAIEELERTTDWVVFQADDGILAGSAAFNYLMGAGTCVAGWLMVRAALAAASSANEDPFMAAKIATAKFFCAQLLPRTHAYLGTIDDGLMEFDADSRAVLFE